MSRLFLMLGIGLALTAAPACTDLVGPMDDFELPPPDMSLDPNRIAVGDYIATPCAFEKLGDGLAHLRNRHEWALVDIFFGRGSPQGPWDAPTVGELQLVESHGGRVLHPFNVPALRARMILSQIPHLVEEGFWVTVRDVPDATRYDLKLHVGFSRNIVDADLDLIADLGGRVTHQWDFINALGVLLPDRSVPALRVRSDVEYVEVSGVACLA